MLEIAQLSPPAVAFLKQLTGDLISSAVCSTFMFLPGPLEVSFAPGECAGCIPFKMCIGHRNGNNVYVYLPLDLSDPTKKTVVVEEINNSEVCLSWESGVGFECCVPFRFLERHGRTDAEDIANLDMFTAVAACHFQLAGYEGQGVRNNWDKTMFVKALKVIQETEAFQAWRSGEIKKKAEARRAQEEVMGHAMAVAQKASQEIPFDSSPIPTRKQTLPHRSIDEVDTSEMHRQPMPQSDRVSAILELEARQYQTQDQQGDIGKQLQVSLLEGRLSATQKVALERRRALGKTDINKD
ncbi:hypothetical protein K491DRAFT_723679 [Lophiostoma macrostomum CBS 122681]|uniref:Uncharacterized protein n=1 Tax=Lophiostoma macrostomum CBS 122681 TaxID=1314788 RepID=A0A6A6SJJ8_9PLEO|nr:hypothetical protein K491DRAFT_723679 [Lophiostoma macrostomum CBS 122681]